VLEAAVAVTKVQTCFSSVGVVEMRRTKRSQANARIIEYQIK
jgi:hypothetical protein